MIADDSDAIRLVLKDILSIGKHQVVVEATDGAEAVDFYQKHTHKIKGLAPMMGKGELGSFVAMLDSILKKMIDGITLNGVFNDMSDSISSIKQNMSEPNYDLAEIRNRISQILNNLN